MCTYHNVLLIILVSSVLVSSASISKICERNHLVTGQNCFMEWRHLNDWLHPTQPAIGFAWAIKKANTYNSANDAQDDMAGTIIPVVIGPSDINGDASVYAVDGHHSLCALDLSPYGNTKVTIKPLCNWSQLSLSSFWAEMRAAGFAYLNSHPNAEPNTLPSPISPTNLPPRFKFDEEGTLFLDDPWRSFGGFVRKVKTPDCPLTNRYCGRGYERVCAANKGGIPFIEFRWAFFMNDAYSEFKASKNASLWNNNASAAARFEAAYSLLPVPIPSPSSPIDIDMWMDAAQFLVPLCRGHSAGSYVLPLNNFPFSNCHLLPGYYSDKRSPIIPTTDPLCDPPLCPTCFATTAANTETVTAQQAALKYTYTTQLNHLIDKYSVVSAEVPNLYGNSVHGPTIPEETLDKLAAVGVDPDENLLGSNIYL